MHFLDFFSDSPKFFIFEKDNNKTNFGGVLMIIYILAMSLITMYYIIDYKNAENYDIQYTKIMNFYNTNLFNYINNYDMNRNPKLDLTFIIAKTPFSENIKLFELYEQKFFDKNIVKNVTNFYIVVLYKCDDKNCTIPIENTWDLLFKFSMIYNTSIINHQNPTSAIEKSYALFYNYFYFDNRTELIPDYHVVKYIEKKGFFKEEKVSFSGYFENSKSYYFENLIMPINGTYYKILQELHINNDHMIEEKYEIKEKDMFDYIGIVLSFYSNGFFILKLIFGFYSKNFNNYKIMEKILSKNNNNNSVNYKKPLENYIISINSNSRSESCEDIDKNENLIENTNGKENELISSYNEEGDNESIIKLKKIRFIHFFLNNLYCKCCSRFNTQEILNICNKILYRYISLDSIAYNQILLENLFRDYKWNDPDLRNIYNNNLIIELRNHIT